ncbi:MAG: Crp/Fnr family transcriptional regulator, partial [Anaerolineales bacterium]|nr:Crp/Fnr family transcriptional regulator [Anaerolineales bacterium]
RMKMIPPELLRRFPYFGFMDDAQLKAVAMIADELSFEKGTVIVEAGQPADAFYFLIEGSVSYNFVVTTESDPSYSKEYYVGDFNPGEVCGVSALIEPYIYTARLRVDKPGRAIRINASSLRALCDRDPKLAYGLMRETAKSVMERLEYTRVQLVAAKR